MHGITPDEEAAILAIVEEFKDIDRSHRKLAHRGSYQGRVWVSPSTFRRVLAARALEQEGMMDAIGDRLDGRIPQAGALMGCLGAQLDLDLPP